jgi:hypothetical protein
VDSTAAPTGDAAVERDQDRRVMNVAPLERISVREELDELGHVLPSTWGPITTPSNSSTTTAGSRSPAPSRRIMQNA